MTTKQLSFFDATGPVRPADTNIVPEARPRLSRQCRAILAMLRERPRSASELAAVTHRFGGRLYDLRRAGCTIGTEHEPATGLSRYTLLHEPEELA